MEIYILYIQDKNTINNKFKYLRTSSTHMLEYLASL